jgi:hypothetical protein
VNPETATTTNQGGTRSIKAVGGQGGGAPPLPPIQNKKRRLQPEREGPDRQTTTARPEPERA